MQCVSRDIKKGHFDAKRPNLIPDPFLEPQAPATLLRSAPAMGMTWTTALPSSCPVELRSETTATADVRTNEEALPNRFVACFASGPEQADCDFKPAVIATAMSNARCLQANTFSCSSQSSSIACQKRFYMISRGEQLLTLR